MTKGVLVAPTLRIAPNITCKSDWFSIRSRITRSHGRSKKMQEARRTEQENLQKQKGESTRKSDWKKNSIEQQEESVTRTKNHGGYSTIATPENQKNRSENNRRRRCNRREKRLQTVMDHNNLSLIGRRRVIPYYETR